MIYEQVSMSYLLKKSLNVIFGGSHKLGLPNDVQLINLLKLLFNSDNFFTRVPHWSNIFWTFYEKFDDMGPMNHKLIKPWGIGNFVARTRFIK